MSAKNPVTSTARAVASTVGGPRRAQQCFGLVCVTIISTCFLPTPFPRWPSSSGGTPHCLSPIQPYIYRLILRLNLSKSPPHSYPCQEISLPFPSIFLPFLVSLPSSLPHLLSLHPSLSLISLCLCSCVSGRMLL